MPTFLHQPSTSLLCHHHRRKWLSRYQPSQSFCVTVDVNISISIIITPLFIFNRSTWSGVPSFSSKTEGSKIGTVSCNNQYLFIYFKPIYVFYFFVRFSPTCFMADDGQPTCDACAPGYGGRRCNRQVPMQSIVTVQLSSFSIKDPFKSTIYFYYLNWSFHLFLSGVSSLTLAILLSREGRASVVIV